MKQKTKEKQPIFKKYFIWLSISYIIVGSILSIFNYVYKSAFLAQLSFVIGLLLILGGSVTLIVFLSRKGYLYNETSEFTIGFLMIFIGLYAVFSKDEFARVFSIIVAFSIVFDSIYKIKIGFSQLALKNRFWWIIFITGIITSILSVIILLFPFHYYNISNKYLVTCISLIIDGVINIIVLMYLRFKSSRKDKLNEV